MIPALDTSTGYLPAGIHNASWDEVAKRFVGNSHRVELLRGLLEALQNLRAAGCQSVLLDGSFVSAKPLPSDYDGAWDVRGVDPHALNPVLLDFGNQRAAMKARFKGELFPAQSNAAPGVTYREFFQRDRNGVPKGVIEIDLRSLP